MPRCPYHKTKFTAKFFNQKYCLSDEGCKDAAIKKALEKVRKNADVVWKNEKKHLKLKLKTLGQYEKEAKKEFQKWVRMRDKHLPCISCGTTTASQWDGGHYFKAELYSGLIFHEDNCHKQCSRCNKDLHGNEANYRIGLVKRIGVERVKWLEENKDRLRVYKFTKQELTDIKIKYKQLIKSLTIKQHG